MKLAGREAEAFIERPRPVALVLLHGPEAGRVDHAARRLLDALLGPGAREEMRLERIEGAALRADPAALADAVRATGFFPGARAVHLAGATDGLAPILADLLDDWREGDATVVATAGQLAARSALRKLAEGHRQAVAIGLWPAAPDRAGVERALAREGLSAEPEAAALLLQHAAEMEPGAFDALIERLALYHMGEDGPVRAEEVAAVAPQASEGAVDEAVAHLLRGDGAALGRTLRRLAAQGTSPVQIVIAATRTLTQLLELATAPEGPERAAARLRPPLFGPRRDAAIAAARRWGAARIEAALAQLVETDLALRSGRPLPLGALAERSLMRIALSLGARDRSRGAR